jgi:hypothetical protein
MVRVRVRETLYSVGILKYGTTKNPVHRPGTLQTKPLTSPARRPDGNLEPEENNAY